MSPCLLSPEQECLTYQLCLLSVRGRSVTILLLLLQGKEKFLAILNKYMEIHGTVYYESQRPPEVPAFVKNHGLLPQPEFQQLLRKAKVRLWSLSWPQATVLDNRHLCHPESWQTLSPEGREALHWEGLEKWSVPLSVSAES